MNPALLAASSQRLISQRLTSQRLISQRLSERVHTYWDLQPFVLLTPGREFKKCMYAYTLQLPQLKCLSQRLIRPAAHTSHAAQRLFYLAVLARGPTGYRLHSALTFTLIHYH